MSDFSSTVRGSILPSIISTSVTAPVTGIPITSAAALTAFSTLYSTRQSLVSETDGVLSTITFIATSIITNASQYSSLTAAAAASATTSASSKKHSSSSNSPTPSPTTSTSSNSPSSNLSTVIPAVVVPILFLLIAAGLVVAFLRRPRKRASHPKEPQSRFDKPELDTTEVPKTHGKQELEASEVPRMKGQVGEHASWSAGLSPGADIDISSIGHAAHELPGSIDRLAELEGSTVRV